MEAVDLKKVLTIFAVQEMAAYLMRVLGNSELIEKPLKSSLHPAILLGAPAERIENGLSGVTSDQRWSSQTSTILLSRKPEHKILM